MSPELTLTEAAAAHLREELGGRLLRIAFTTGCGGSGYRLGHATEAMEGDVELDLGGIRIALDSMAASRLDGAVITWDEDEQGYLLEHPDAVTVAWCG